MARRAVRKIDPLLDLSRQLRRLEELASPLDAAALFGRSGPLDVEVGSGRGLFLETASASFPDHNLLGCEVSHKYARFAAARLARLGRDNTIVIDGDAMRLFGEFLSAGSAASVHVYFPDPWWKQRHRKRRIMNPMFLRHVERVLAPGRPLHFWTDVEEYFRETLQCIAAETGLSGPQEDEQRPAAHDMDYRTHFERRMRRHGVPVFRAVFLRLA